MPIQTKASVPPDRRIEEVHVDESWSTIANAWTRRVTLVLSCGHSIDWAGFVARTPQVGDTRTCGTCLVHPVADQPQNIFAGKTVDAWL